MAKQDRGLTGARKWAAHRMDAIVFVHNAIVIVWTVVSTLLYASVAICVSPLSNKLSRSLAHLWCIHLLFFCGIRVKTVGEDKISKKERYVFVANHQSYFDIPVLYAGLPCSLSFIAKKELFFIPFFGWGMAAVGHIWINRNNPRAARASITRAIGMLKRKNISLVLFPEGTRSTTDDVGQFKRGSFALTMEADVPAVPVTICGTRDVLPKHRGSFRSGTVTLVIGDPISPQELTGLDKQKLSDMLRERIVAGKGRIEDSP